MMLSFYNYITESTKRTAVGLIVLSALGFAFMRVASAATSYDVVNPPQMFLSVSITATQTSDIKLAALTRNGATVTFPTTSGGVLRLRSGSKVEDIAYTSATVAASKIVTLVGVTRDVCWNVFNTLYTCGGGQSFPKGSVVELTVDARLLNSKANRDRANTFSAPQTFGSGITLIGTAQALRVTQVTTAQRDAIASPANGMIVYNTTTSLLNQYIGGAWVAVGTDATPSGGYFTAGKWQGIGTNTGALLNRTQSGSVGPFALTPSITKVTSSGSLDYGRIPVLNSAGKLANGFLPSSQLTQVTKSANYNASVGDQVLANAAGGTFTITLPSTPRAEDRIGVLLTNSGANYTPVRIKGAGTSPNILDRQTTSGGLHLFTKGDYVELTNSGATTWFVSNDQRLAHRALLRRAAAQTIPGGSLSKIFLDTTDFDIGGMKDTGTGGRLTIRREGQYLISVAGMFAVGDTQSVIVSLFKNGSAIRAVNGQASTAGNIQISGTFMLPLVVGDYLELKIRQDSGSPAATSTVADQQPTLSATEILR